MGIFISTYFLAPSQENLLGLCIASFYSKSRNSHYYSSEIVEGIIVESKIRSFIISHHAFNRSVKKLNKLYLRGNEKSMYLFYDHLMACKLKSMNSDCYFDIVQEINNSLKDNRELLSVNFRQVINKIIKHDILHKFDSIGGVHELMNFLCSGNLYNIRAMNAIEDLIDKYDSILKDFNEIIPDLEKYIEDEIIVRNFITHK